MEARINQRLELVIGGQPYTSRVEEVQGRRLWVSAPFGRDGRVLPLRSGTSITGRLLDPQGIWEFAGRISGTRDDAVPLVGVDLVGELVLTESRNAARYDCVERIQIVMIGSQQAIPREGRLLDISVRGARAEIMNPYPEPRPGQQVIVTVMRNPPMVLGGQIVWSRPVLTRGRNYMVGVRWLPNSTAAGRHLVMTVVGPMEETQ